MQSLVGKTRGDVAFLREKKKKKLLLLFTHHPSLLFRHRVFIAEEGINQKANRAQRAPGARHTGEVLHFSPDPPPQGKLQLNGSALELIT